MSTTQLEDQKKLWNGAGACGWIASQPLLDQVFQPLEDLLVSSIQAAGARDVLDVGCGTGATTIAAARAVGGEGRATGIDISEPMIAIARERALANRNHAQFIAADAATYAFEPARFDLIISRFGVMFFADPVQAFANLRKAAAPSAALRCLAWRSVDDNPFMTTAERAAAPLLPALPPRRAGAAGQFAFADSRHVTSILDSSGWIDVDVRPVDVECAFPAAALIQYVTQLGPVGRLLQEADSDTRAKVIETVLPAFDRYLIGGTVRFSAACWELRAVAAE